MHKSTLSPTLFAALQCALHLTLCLLYNQTATELYRKFSKKKKKTIYHQPQNMTRFGCKIED